MLFPLQLNPLSDTGYPAQTAAYTTHAETATWNAGPQFVLVWCTTNAYVAVGEAAVATVASTPIPANSPVLMKVPPGTGAPWRVSAVQVAAGGSVFAKPCNGN